MSSLGILDTRPVPGAPRDYHFPAFTRQVLPNGLTLIRVHVPGRPLLVAQLVIGAGARGGAASEPIDQAGLTVLMARAMTEGTARRDANDLIEASERLGAELSADAGWDSVGASVEVPRSRLVPALELLAEIALEPSFPEEEIERLRDERLNDLLQARAEPRRRVERVFPETIFAPGAPYARPMGGSEASVPGLDRAAAVARHEELFRPDGSALVIGGDLEGVPLEREVERIFGGWRSGPPSHQVPLPASAPHPSGRRVVVVDRPGSPQSEVRIGHIGEARRTPAFHALSVLNAILGGLFNSRLNHLLREQKGYTYGVNSGFEMRREAGPFAVRCAVKTEVTLAAIEDILGELRRIRDDAVTDAELAMARDYLVGVFPLRFETAGQVSGAIAGLVALGLPDDELDRYRPAIAAISAAQVLDAARASVRPDEASIVVVGDAARFEDALRDAGLGDVTVIRDETAEEDAAA